VSTSISQIGGNCEHSRLQIVLLHDTRHCHELGRGQEYPTFYTHGNVCTDMTDCEDSGIFITVLNTTYYIISIVIQNSVGGTRWRSWLRHCATSRKVAGSIPGGVIENF